jgi:hypothetical protein
MKTWEMNTWFRWGKLKATDHFKDLGTCGTIILKGISKKQEGMIRTFIWLRTGDKWWALDHANENLVPPKCGNSLTS